MAQPGADGVDVHAGSQKMRGGRVSKRMRAHSLCGQCWQLCRYSLCIAFHHCVNAKARDWATTSIEKDVLMLSSVVEQCGKRSRRMRPQGTAAQFVAFPVDLY